MLLTRSRFTQSLVGSIRAFSNVRVRFAPSPTGDLHLGGLRTALFNYAFAKHEDGKFILRIEDTDQTRLVPGAQKQIQDLLNQFGLVPDESPEKGGPYGPYVQSERLQYYQEIAKELLDRDAVFPCFCSQRRLKMLKENAHGSSTLGGYDNRCLFLDKKESLRRMESGEPYVLRLKPPKEDIVVHDKIKGDVVFKASQVDAQVLLKSDGFPTYHLANVVDDHMMEITHVIRGEEWLPSTPKHILLYKAMGWKIPTFAHIPLLLNENKKKLSKREGHSSVLSLLQNDYSPESILSFISTLGWTGIDPHIIDKKNSIYTLDDICRYFTLENVNSSNAIVTVKNLQYENHNYLSSLPTTIDGCEKIYAHISTSIDQLASTLADQKSDYYYKQMDLLFNKQTLFEIFKLCSTRCHYMNDFYHFLESLYIHPWTNSKNSIYTTYQLPDSIRKNSSLLVDSLKSIPSSSFNHDSISQLLSPMNVSFDLSVSQFLMAIRVMLTGSKKGFSLYDTISLIGKEETLYRIQYYLEHY